MKCYNKVTGKFCQLNVICDIGSCNRMFCPSCGTKYAPWELRSGFCPSPHCNTRCHSIDQPIPYHLTLQTVEVHHESI